MPDLTERLLTLGHQILAGMEKEERDPPPCPNRSCEYFDKITFVQEDPKQPGKMICRSCKGVCTAA